MTDTIIATVMTEDGQYCEDLELPAMISVEELSVELAHALSETVPGMMSDVNTLQLYYKGEPIPSDKSLLSAGIWDGSILTIRR